MITVTLLGGDHRPMDEGISLQLVEGDGGVVAAATTDAAGVARFDVDGSGIREARVRLSRERPGEPGERPG